MFVRKVDGKKCRVGESVHLVQDHQARSSSGRQQDIPPRAQTCSASGVSADCPPR